jgi:hypothetical protein
MNRSDWLKEKRREAEERYDTLWAPLYGEKWGVYSNATHQQFIQKFLSLLPQPSTIGSQGRVQEPRDCRKSVHRSRSHSTRRCG